MLSGKVASATALPPFIAVKSSAGWSLLEVLCVLALLAMVNAAWLPTWQHALDGLTLQQQHQVFLQQLRQAKAWAQQHQQGVVLAGWHGPSSATIVSFVDANDDRRWQANEQLLNRQVYQAQVRFNRGAYVRFSSTGTTAQAGSWRLCLAPVPQGWKVVLSSSGNVRSVRLDCHA